MSTDPGIGTSAVQPRSAPFTDRDFAGWSLIPGSGITVVRQTSDLALPGGHIIAFGGTPTASALMILSPIFPLEPGVPHMLRLNIKYAAGAANSFNPYIHRASDNAGIIGPFSGIYGDGDVQQVSPTGWLFTPTSAAYFRVGVSQEAGATAAIDYTLREARITRQA